ncbi:MAG TPA: histidine kinase [Jiangellaceae bacterium]|nr:histidine kinase [Jiangellaceae bacterium]
MRGVWLDRSLVAVATVLQAASVRPGPAEADDPLRDTVGALTGVAGGLALWFRHRAPLAVLAATVLAYVVQAAMLGPVLPVAVAVACYSVARRDGSWRGAGIALLGVLVVASTVVAIGSVGLAPTFAAALLIAVLAGALGAAREARVGAATRAAVLEERLRIARDLHDVVGHGMGAITVQAGAGRMALDAGADDDVRRALVTIEQAGRGVLRDIRWLVGVLRERPQQASLADLAVLADAARGAGLAVEVTVDGILDGVPAATAEAAYRIAQESLTNVLRHSGADRAQMRIGIDEAVTLSVRDDGTGTAAAEGNGIRGMRERAAAVGGDLHAGPRADGPGWEITVRLPITRGRR